MNLLKAGLFALTVLTPLKALGHEAPIRVVASAVAHSRKHHRDR
jgi:hypothetical protein